MTLNSNQDHSIDLETASEWTENYRNASSANATLAHCFGKDAIDSILSQTGCVGIRIYYAQNGNGEDQLIVTGVNADGNDLYEGLLAERALKTPPYSVASNPLNS